MKCFYHNDMDGKCSGAIVYQYYKGKGEYIQISYNDDFPFETIEKNERIFIVDFSLQKSGEFKKLLKITSDIIWIDHHKTAIEKHKDIADELEGIREDGTAGCELTWQYFFPNKEMPKIVKLLGDYDVWAFKYGQETKELQAGIKLFDNHPDSDNWLNWLWSSDDPYILDGIIESGKIVFKYQTNFNKSQMFRSFYIDFEGYRCICCNSGVFNSQLFDSISNDTFDIMIPFVWNGSGWSVSLYTKKDDIDCSEIAKKYDGGGHRQAAGFQCDKLPFKFEDLDIGKGN